MTLYKEQSEQSSSLSSEKKKTCLILSSATSCNFVTIKLKLVTAKLLNAVEHNFIIHIRKKKVLMQVLHKGS